MTHLKDLTRLYIYMRTGLWQARPDRHARRPLWGCQSPSWRPSSLDTPQSPIPSVSEPQTATGLAFWTIWPPVDTLVPRPAGATPQTPQAVSREVCSACVHIVYICDQHDSTGEYYIRLPGYIPNPLAWINSSTRDGYQLHCCLSLDIPAALSLRPHFIYTYI